MKRGRPFESGNKFGCGRPQGSPNKKKLLAQKIFDDNAPAIMALAINTARDDRQMLRTLISQVGRRMGDRPVRLGRILMKTIQDLDQASVTILNKVVAGKLSIGEGTDLFAMIEIRRHVLTDVGLDARIRALESGGQLLKEAA